MVILGVRPCGGCSAGQLAQPQMVGRGLWPGTMLLDAQDPPGQSPCQQRHFELRASRSMPESGQMVRSDHAVAARPGLADPRVPGLLGLFDPFSTPVQFFTYSS